MDNEKLQVEKQHMDWWNNLSDNEEISILKEEGIFGHDQGVTEAEIKSFYKSRVITPAPLSEQKQEVETVEKDIAGLVQGYKDRHDPETMAEQVQCDKYRYGCRDGYKLALDKFQPYRDNILPEESTKEAAIAYSVGKSSSEVFRLANIEDFTAGAQWQSQYTAKQIEDLTTKYNESNTLYNEQEAIVEPLQREIILKDAEIDQYKARVGELEAENENYKKAYIEINRLWNINGKHTEQGLFQAMQVFVKLNLPVPNSI